MFCYPGGKYDEETVQVVREAGYVGARTTGKDPRVADPFLLGVSLTFFPSPFTTQDILYTGYRRVMQPLADILPASLSGESWQSHDVLEKRTLALFDEAHASRGVFHLYGHSWANTRYGLWPVLERVLQRIGKRSDCEYLTNGELVHRFT
jgi:peptidoglycan/xylan/chitin deacetylase (PgdA/CDA1 family)